MNPIVTKVIELRRAGLTDKEIRLSRPEAADWLQVKPTSLACWAMQPGRGPKYTRIGSRTTYSLADLAAFVDARTVAGTA